MAKLSSEIKSLSPIDNKYKVDTVIEILIKRRTYINSSVNDMICNRIKDRNILDYYNSKIIQVRKENGGCIAAQDISAKPTPKKKKDPNARPFSYNGLSENDPIRKMMGNSRKGYKSPSTKKRDYFDESYEYGLSDW